MAVRMGRGLVLVLGVLLLALTHAAAGQRRRKPSLLRDTGNDLPCSLELAFILDSSESAKTFLFEKQKSFVVQLSARLALLQVSGWTLRVRMAALQYSSSVYVEHSFSGWQDLDVFHSTVISMVYIGHGTYTTYAITNATRLFTQETAVDSVRVAVVMTDGSDHPRNPDVFGAVAKAKGLGVWFFAVGLSDLAHQGQNSAKLRAIASEPPQQFVQSLTDPQLEEKILKAISSIALEECPLPNVCACDRGERGPQGSPGRKGDPGYMGPTGLKGQRGEPGVSGYPGSEGPEGRPGFKGDKGERGDCGSPGADGDVGPEGPPGLRGPRGEQGSTGLAGDQGPEGQEGPKGERGPAGVAGPHGDIGIGFPGPKGIKGLQGRSGPPGPSGVGDPGQPGPAGPPGAQGMAGPAGEGLPGQKGDRGFEGPKGSRGLAAAGVKGEKGSYGQPGPPGPAGLLGSGIQGEKGVQGPVGPAGPRGTPGVGPLGPKGSVGFPGPAGAPGKTGVGMPGPKGAPGAEGPAGFPGLPGEDGTSGLKGDMGLPGPRGPDGTAGKGFPGEKGDRGERGPRGQLGPVGPVGPQGPKGEAGDTGPPGSSGPPGHGVPGTKGDPGPVGPVGPVGDPGIGIAGPKGDRGLPGPSGGPGLKGEGDHGPPGPPGVPGPAGEDGPEGQGLPGPKGDRGLPGPSGPAGPPGISLIGPKGSEGRGGVPGASGIPGEGIQGQKGEPGFQGLTGPRGPPGQGLEGEKGGRGLSGGQGRKGERGETGEAGAAGSLGRLGQKGEPGLTREEVIKLVRSICGCGVKCRERPLELVFVIDSSESVGPDNFKMVKDFVNGLVDRASVGRETTRVGVVLYSHINVVTVSLRQQSTRDQVKAAVSSMAYLGEGTFTGSAIHQANQVFQAARPGVRKVGIIITDGQADPRDSVKLEVAVKEAHESNIEMFVIGVVNQSDPLYAEFRKELHLIASAPDEEHVYLVDDFRTLPALESKLLGHICEKEEEKPWFSSIPSSRFSPGAPAAAGAVRETLDRSETDTPTVTGDFTRTQMEPAPPAPDRGFIPHGPRDPDPLETHRVPSFDRKPYQPMTELPPSSEKRRAPTHSMAVMGPQAYTSRTLTPERTPAPLPITPPPPKDTFMRDESCGHALDPGPCREYVVKWYYDATANACAQFWFGGCLGNKNQFETEKNCKKACVNV